MFVVLRLLPNAPTPASVSRDAGFKLTPRLPDAA